MYAVYWIYSNGVVVNVKRDIANPHEADDIAREAAEKKEDAPKRRHPEFRRVKCIYSHSTNTLKEGYKRVIYAIAVAYNAGVKNLEQEVPVTFGVLYIEDQDK